ncbi:glycosyltransferase family 2 protein [Yeosuana marina]|uniref:glycosyltransferase family 2 protein n=1 Tax=Yeosuana marina TaxID=1565536 RepID=UPI00142268F8|nr:glycosyltransferase family 2 protein [Yeosuana marina]
MNLVSIIIPTYKRSNRLPIAINSVLNQTYPNIEIIVVDDNGDNQYSAETKKTLQPYLDNNQIIYIAHKTNQGGCEARNTGAFAAKGNFIAFLDDDDFYEPTKIEEQVNFINNHKDLDACICSMYRIDENNEQIKSRENIARGVTLQEAILDGNLFTSMLLIKKEVFIKLDGFSEIPRFQDKYFHYKFLENNYKIGVLNKQLLTLVEHSDIRISLAAHDKIIKALDTLHKVELQHKKRFSHKEWRFIMHRLFYNKAYTVSQGSFKNKMVGLGYIIKSLPYYTGNYNCFKLALKTLTPNFILKLNRKRNDT